MNTSSQFGGELQAHVKAMSDQELYESLKALDPKIGPVTVASRSVYEKKYMRLTMKAAGDDHSVSRSPGEISYQGAYETDDASKEESFLQQEQLKRQQEVELQQQQREIQQQQQQLEKHRMEQLEREEALRRKEDTMRKKEEEERRRQRDEMMRRQEEEERRRQRDEMMRRQEEEERRRKREELMRREEEERRRKREELMRREEEDRRRNRVEMMRREEEEMLKRKMAEDVLKREEEERRRLRDETALRRGEEERRRREDEERRRKRDEMLRRDEGLFTERTRFDESPRISSLGGRMEIGGRAALRDTKGIFGEDITPPRSSQHRTFEGLHDSIQVTKQRQSSHSIEGPLHRTPITPQFSSSTFSGLSRRPLKGDEDVGMHAGSEASDTTSPASSSTLCLALVVASIFVFVLLIYYLLDQSPVPTIDKN